jgi:drug/metabolite transporter (DMT)-like permease
MNGKVLLFFAIATFIIQSEIVQAVQTHDFYKPYFILYVGHSLYSILLLIIYLHERFHKQASHSEAFNSIFKSASTLPKFGIPQQEIDLPKRIMILTFLFTFASLPWYISVSKIPLGEVSAIFNTSCFFTYFLAMIFLNERFQWVKLFAVLVSVLGIFAIALGNEFKIPILELAKIPKMDPGKVIGYSSAILSSIGVSTYEVLYAKTVIPHVPSIKFALFIAGSMGVITMFGGILLFPVLHFTGLEVFEFPTWSAFGFVLLNGLLGVTYNVLFLLVITFSGPLFASVGVLMSIPMTSLVDMAVLGTPFGLNMAIGTMLIFLGFILLQLNSIKGEEVEISDQEQQPLLDDLES